MGKTDQGVNLDRYMMIPRSLCFLFRAGRVLLIKGAADKRRWAGKYNGIGGHYERGEDIHTGAQREITEETGLTPDSLWLCGFISVETGAGPGVGIFVFKGDSASGEVHASPEGQLEWTDLGALDGLPLVEDLVELLPRVSAKNPGDRPFIARYEYDRDDRLVMHFAVD